MNQKIKTVQSPEKTHKIFILELTIILPDYEVSKEDDLKVHQSEIGVNTIVQSTMFRQRLLSAFKTLINEVINTCFPPVGSIIKVIKAYQNPQ